MESISGVLWKCKYGIAGSVYWKKKFTYLDSEKLLHWQTEKRPTESDKTPPRHGFLLHRCEITEEPKLRPCAFKITDKLDNRSMIFACNNVAEYDKWMKILSMEHKDPATKDDPSVDESGTLEDEHGFDFDFNFDNDNQSLETADDFNIRTTDGTLPHMQSFKAAAPSFVDAKSALAASAMFSASILIPGKPTVAPKVTVADIAKAFFQRSDGQEDPPLFINQRELEKLLEELKLGVNPSATAKHIFASLNISSGFISLGEFLSWCDNFVNDRQATIITLARTIIDKVEITVDASKLQRPYTIGPSSHMSGVVDVSTVLEMSPSTCSLLSLHLPSCPRVIHGVAPCRDPSEFNTQQQWAEAYDYCYKLANDHSRRKDHRKHDGESVISLSRSVSQMSVLTDSSMGSQPAERDTQPRKWADEGDAEEQTELANSLQYAAVVGAFLQAASLGARTVIDEYSLPDAQKSAPRLSTDLGATVWRCDCDSCRGLSVFDPKDNASTGEVFAFKGLLIRLISHSGGEVDQVGKCTTSRAQYLRRVDAVSHKISSAEYRSQVVLEKATQDIGHAYAELHRLLHSGHISRSFYAKIAECIRKDPVFGLSSARGREKGLCVFRSLLSTVVNYSGFRLQVMCPLLQLSEFRTLLYGWTKKDGVDMFVDNPHVGTCLTKVARAANLAPSYMHCNAVCTEPLAELEASSESDFQLATNSSIVSVLCRELQAHKESPNGQSVYLLNTQQLLPCDLPAMPSDLSTRCLRPELVRTALQPLSGLAFRVESIASQTEEGLGSSLNTIEADLQKKQLKINALALEHLYTVVLPHVAAQLDSLVYLPIDSLSLTNYLHARGVCCRHLGLLWGLCGASHSRTLLLQEAVARSAKSLLAEMLRTHCRQFRGSCLSAILRGRSNAADFLELQQEMVQSRTGVVLGFFNVMFGASADSKRFWEDNGVLAASLESKFGFKGVSNFHRSENSSNLFQLFLNVQYHSGVRFIDSVDYCLCSPSHPRPFRASDIIIVAPESKSNIVLPGTLGRCHSQSVLLPEALMVAGLLDQAVNAFRIRLSLTHCLAPRAINQSLKGVTHRGHTVLMLALALLLNGSQSHLEEALELLRDELGWIPKYAPIGVRLMTLLACVQLGLGDSINAVHTFDAASAACSACFGAGSLHMILHLTSFSDAYRAVGAHGQSRVMLTVSHGLACASLGTSHALSCEYARKLALLCVEQSDPAAALQYLEECIPVLEQTLVAHASSPSVESTKSALYQCLTLQVGALADLREVDKALECCHNLIKRASSFKSALNQEDTLVAELSVLVLLADLYVRNQDLRSAQDSLLRAHSLLQSITNSTETILSEATRQGKGLNLGLSTAKLTLKLLSLELTAMSRQTRSFAEKVALETLQDIRDQGSSVKSIEACDIHLRSLPSSWSDELLKLLDELWKNSPAKMITDAVQDVVESEHSEDLSDVGPDHDGPKSTVHVRLALIVKLIRRRAFA